MNSFRNDQNNDVVVKVPLKEFIEINEKVRRYDRMMEVINDRRSARTPRSMEVRGSDGIRTR